MTALSLARGPDQPPLLELTIGALLQRAAAQAPQALALVAGSPDPAQRRQWTYAELLDEATRCAHALLERFEPGERVAVWAHNIPQWLVLEFGAALAGVVLVTVNPALRAAEVEYVLSQSRAAGVFTLDGLRGFAMLEAVQALQPRCPALRHVIRFAEWDAFIAGAAPRPLPAVQPGDAAMIQYTSGTTGFPKGALLHHRGLVNNSLMVHQRMGLTEPPVWIGTMPLFHTGGCALAVLGTVARAGTLVLVESFEPGLVLALTHQFGGHVVTGVPTMLIAMLEHPDFERTDFSRVKAICCGGSTVPPELVRRLEQRLGAPFTIVYGQTECSPVATMTHPGDRIEDKAGTIGRPLAHVEMKVADPLDGRPLPQGELGELCTRGFHVMRGYFDMPEASAAAVDAEGWLHTGDLGRMDARGFCTIEGRLKDMIIRGGENIYPREIEDLLYRHASVGEVAVLGLPDARWGEQVAAFIRPAAGQRVDKDELFAWLREQLAPHKTPRLWFELQAFPLTGSGKIQKFRLREMCGSGALRPL
ncbi:MAG: AMP-binding protein [Proteobacteria bacterium]|nr:AMP-binding protein [Pseudomonadota bacterium]